MPLKETHNPDLSIVIVNMNAAEMLEGCLKSIRETQGLVETEVVLIDNGSTDNSIELALRERPDIVLLGQERNIGYVPANNLGLHRARGRYVMFLNNDTLIEPKCLEELVRFLDENPQVGAVSGKILNPDGTDQGTARRFPTIANAIFGRRSVLTRLLPHNRWSQRYMVGRQRTDDLPFEVEILSSACLVVRTDLARELGGMDEDFKLYWVDAEMCSRIRTRGYKVYCMPRARIIHFEGQGGSTRTFLERCRATVAFHQDAYYAYTKVYGLRPWRPIALATGGLLASRAACLMVLQLMRPGKATSSGGKN